MVDETAGDDPILELESLLVEGEKLAEAGHLDESFEVFKSATEKFPDSALAHYNLSVAYFLKLKIDKSQDLWWENKVDDETLLEEAISECRAAVDLEPNFVAALSNLGLLLALSGQKIEAIEIWETSLKLESDQPELRDDLAALKESL